VQERGSRFWDTFWVVGPLVVGGLVGFYLAGQFPATVADCSQVAQGTNTSANFVLAVVLVALLVGRVVAGSTIGPVAGRAFTIAAFGLVVSACGTFFITTRTEPCPSSGLASGHEAMVRVPHAQLHLP
jgi:hypothetical protein